MKTRFEQHMHRHQGIAWAEVRAKLENDDIRALGGALFCDRRYGKVFVYHNGAQSYEQGIGAARAALDQTLLSLTSSLWES